MSQSPTATESTPTPAPVDAAAAPPSINLLILVTGSIAAVKIGLLLDQLGSERCNIRIAATKSAFHFLHRAQPSTTGIPFQSILTDEQEWSEWQAMNDAVVHIELRRWADLVLIAPLDANSLAKIAHGLCDNLVTCVMRAWEVRRKPVILCPAMNTAMWTHPITAKQLTDLRSWYSASDSSLLAANADPLAETPQAATLSDAMFQLVGPVSKRLACGDVGVGGMAHVEDIARAVKHTMALVRAAKVSAAAAAAAAAESTASVEPTPASS